MMDISNMDAFFKLFGIEQELFLSLAAVVFLCVEALKRTIRKADKTPILTGGIKTHFVTFILGLLVALKANVGQWDTSIACAFGIWVVTSGTYSVIKGTYTGWKNGKK